jgi:hypothetical protein
VAGAALAVRGVHGDVQAGGPHHLVAAAEPAGIAQLGQDGRGGDGADPVVGGDQCPAARLAAGQAAQPPVNRVQLGVQSVDLP